MADDTEMLFEDIEDSDEDELVGLAGVPGSRRPLSFRRRGASGGGAGSLPLRATSTRGWSCKMCTLDNAASESKCAACSTPRLPVCTARVAPIFQKSRSAGGGRAGAGAGAGGGGGGGGGGANDGRRGGAGAGSHGPCNVRGSAGVGSDTSHNHDSQRGSSRARGATQPAATTAAVPRQRPRSVRGNNIHVGSAVGPKRRQATLREQARAAEQRRRASGGGGSGGGGARAAVMTLPLPAMPGQARGPAATPVMKYRLPFFKSIAQLEAEGIELFDFNNLFSSGTERVMLRTTEGCKCGSSSTCSKMCLCRKVGKVCDPAMCGCDPLKCKNTRENALLQAVKEANVGHWITREGKRIYFDKDGNEYSGTAAMRRYEKDKKGSGAAAKKKSGSGRKARKPRRKRPRRGGRQ